jgi:hypothetical protein
MSVSTRFIADSNRVGSWSEFIEKKKNASVGVFVDDKSASIAYDKDSSTEGTTFALVLRPEGIFFVNNGQEHPVDEEVFKKKLKTFLKSFVKLI